MLRDTFYRQILQAFESLDPQVFERCMGDLLRPDFPGLVPVPGGGDSGFDGIIPDRRGAFPLVCTTGKDVKRNLSGSLDSVAKRGWPARRVALATSQALTPQQRLDLFDKAQAKGFRMMQVFDRSALADRLYRSRRWCKDLLHLEGLPSPLSVVPLTRRPLVDLEPIGRQQDLEWLEGMAEDRVLVGEPGSGKTHLLRHLMLFRSWPALFLVSQDFDGGAVHNAIRDLEPRVVVVDDAHGNPSDLVRLVQLRRETGANFHIVATTWKGMQDEVVAKLGVSPAQVQRLELLTRDEIVQVFRASGVRTDDERLRLLVNQAANRPGLAVTIASLWLQDRWNELIDGTALSRDLLTFFHEFVGKESTDVLAAFSLGGDRGMTLDSVREFLGLSRIELRRIADGLAAGGALREVDGDTLAVWPRELRNPLLRAVFFPGSAAKHPYRELLGTVPNLPSAIATLVNASLFGAPVPREELKDLVLEAGSLEAWRGLTALGEAEAFWVLENYPGSIEDIVPAALIHAPDAAILRLLKVAEQEVPARPFALPWTSPLRIWVEDLAVPLQTMVRRRKMLANTVKRYLRAGGKLSLGLQAVCLALSPLLETNSLDPGAGWILSSRRGQVPPEQLRELSEAILVEIRDSLQGIESADWPHLSSLFWVWMHPSYASRGQEVQEEVEKSMLSCAAALLSSIAPFAHGKPGLTSKLREIARQLETDLSLEPDLIFELLFSFPDYSLEDREQEQRYSEWKDALKELAIQWAIREPVEIAKLLAHYEVEAQGIGRATPPRGVSIVCERIAALTAEPVVWLDALLEQGVSGDLTRPFIERVMAERREGWEREVERFLSLDRRHDGSAVEAILRSSSPPPHLLEEALRRLDKFPQLLENLCLRRKVPLETLRMLLHHFRWELALTAAVGEWNSDREGGVRAEVASDWRSAILRASVDSLADRDLRSSNRDYWLGVILVKDPNLAFDWLVARLRDAEELCFIAGDDPIRLASSVLTMEQRLQMVEELEKGHCPSEFIGLLVGQDSAVFAKVLAAEALRDHHLEPLESLPDENWMELALLALGGGHNLDEVVQASHRWPKGAVISMIPGVEPSERWQERERAFSRFKTDSRVRVREIARRGQQLAAEERQRAEERERQLAIHGRYV